MGRTKKRDVKTLSLQRARSLMPRDGVRMGKWTKDKGPPSWEPITDYISEEGQGQGEPIPYAGGGI